MTAPRKEHCWNNRPPPADGYWAQSGWEGEGNQIYAPIMKFVWVKNRMSKACGQPGKGHPPLPGCIGCEHLGAVE